MASLMILLHEVFFVVRIEVKHPFPRRALSFVRGVSGSV